MKLCNKLSLAASILLFTSCATSMSPVEVAQTLPTLTKSKFISQSQLESNKCKIITSRSYTAPIGMFAKDDLKYGAKGIDEWVTLDGGNAYILKNYQWVSVNKDQTQLHIDFDTLMCE
ncbi:hypothetical protein [Flavobacterium sp. 22076]|uniref:hypothetical protein n=1 Tax=unclassified Flavobacterium TaxID=196869 RepID=UPI003F8777F8